MPECLVSYVVSGLRGATSRVRTKGGLTDSFSLQSGVRQGDPLAPLIYLFVVDALHAGLERNPLFPEHAEGDGYRFAAGSRPRVCSSGYADDTVIFATSPDAVRRMHAWVRAFFGAHSGRLNCSKSVLLCSPGAGRDLELPSVDGSSCITPAPYGHTLRYLGVWVNLDLDWSVQIARMDRLVWKVSRAMCRNGFDMCMSVTASQLYLLPCLRAGLRVADIPATKLRAWDDRVRRAVLSGAGLSMGRSLNVEAFYALSGVPRLAHHCWALRGEELMVSLNACYPSSDTARARRAAVASVRSLPLRKRRGGRQPDYVWSRDVVTSRTLSSLAKVTVGEAPCLPLVAFATVPATVTLSDPVWSSWTPYVCPVLRSVLPGVAFAPLRVRVFTDGSTGPDPGQPSGCAVVLTIACHVVSEFAFACRASGSNYLAEAVALLAALLSVPSGADIDILTVCEAVCE